MKRIGIKIYILIFLFGVISCEKSKHDVEPIEQKVNSASEQAAQEQMNNEQKNQNEIKDSPNSLKQDVKSANSISITKIDFSRFINADSKYLDPFLLDDVLPLEIKGFEKLPTSRGTISRGAGWTTVSAQYTSKPKGYISIYVNDYGGQFPKEEIAYYSNLPQEKGMVSETVEFSFAKGYKVWNEEQRRGRLLLNVGSRFSVRIEVEYLPAGIPDIAHIFPMMRFKLIHDILVKENK